MGNKRNGLLALLGLGALAWWRYQKSSTEEKQKVKDQIDNVKNNFCKWGNDLKGKVNEVSKKVENSANELKDEAQKAIDKA
ncbi:YtxH domain-containing protein [Bergeyella sp. RCAD1439]|uniref:YtxH domain-containing protein n=1 Tax=Bergeyella anatis TaxID=3113737 RepID=UPI002E179F83|nr:YtxH domain-containing protein [Bergeyella sp. RCAD1439]